MLQFLFHVFPKLRIEYYRHNFEGFGCENDKITLFEDTYSHLPLYLRVISIICLKFNIGVIIQVTIERVKFACFSNGCMSIFIKDTSLLLAVYNCRHQRVLQCHLKKHIRNQEKARKTKQDTFSLNDSFLSAMYFLLQYVHVLFPILLQVLSSESTLYSFETKLSHDFSSDFLTKTSWKDDAVIRICLAVCHKTVFPWPLVLSSMSFLNIFRNWRHFNVSSTHKAWMYMTSHQL
jgi:hypothetical protein